MKEEKAAQQAYLKAEAEKAAKKKALKAEKAKEKARKAAEKEAAKKAEKEIAKNNLDMEVTAYLPQDKHKAVNNVLTKNKNELVTGFLEQTLKKKFPADLTKVYWNREASLLTVFIDTPERFFKFVDC